MNELQRRTTRSPFPFLDGDLDDVFEGFFRPVRVSPMRVSPMRAAEQVRTGALAPAIDVTEHEDRFVVHAELPGFDKNDIQVSLDNGRLTIEAEHTAETKEDGESGRAVVRERRFGRFVRTLEVGRRVDADAISASYRDGVLEVTLPRLSPQQPEGRRIDIQ